jgi:hypothetical protein
MDEPQRSRRPSERKAKEAGLSTSESRTIEPWDRADTFFAMNAAKRGMSIAEIAGFLGRTEDEVLEQIRSLQRTDKEAPLRSRRPNVKRPSRKTAPDDRRRALELLAAHPNGCTEAALAAENIPADVLIELVRSGLALARNERLQGEEGTIEVTRMWITEAGELARVAGF